MTGQTRREVLALGAGSAALAIIGEVRPAAATPQEAAEVIATFTGGKTAEKGKITIDLPEIAENGNTVPLTITVESPMTAEDHVSDVLVVAEGNPRPGFATFHLTPLSGPSRHPSGSPRRRTSWWWRRPARASSSPSRSRSR